MTKPGNLQRVAVLYLAGRRSSASVLSCYMSRRTGMRICLVALFCAVGLAASVGSGTLVDEKADLEKEVRKFQVTWTFESGEVV
jgi:hypothetical protein